MRELSIVKRDFPLLVTARGIDAPIAIKVATDKSETEILKVVNEVVETPRRGMSPNEIKKVLTKLGVKHKDVSLTALNRKKTTNETKLGKHITENEFIEKRAADDKIYLVTNWNHAWVINGKRTVDPLWNNPEGSRRRIVRVFEIDKADVNANIDSVN